MKIPQLRDIRRRSKRNGHKKEFGDLSLATKSSAAAAVAASKRASVNSTNTNTIENEQDQPLCIFLSRCPGTTNHLVLNNQNNSIQHSLTLQSIGEIPVSDFLRSFRDNGSQFISSAYLMSSRNPIDRSAITGILSTPLPEDIFTLVDAQLTLLDEFLSATSLTMTDTGNAITVDALLSIFRILYYKQSHYAYDSLFLRDFDSCIARSNDYWRMAKKTDRMIHHLSKERYPHLNWNSTKSKMRKRKKKMEPEWDRSTNLVEQKASNLVDLFTSDAIQASQRTAIYIIKAIQQSDIPREFFSRHWEELTNNEVAKYTVRVYGDYLSDIKQTLESEYLYQKIVCTLIRCTVCFYIKCFILKAERVRRYGRRRNSNRIRTDLFLSPNRAILRMTHDIEVFQKFFLRISEGSTTLERIATNECSVLNVLFLECMAYAAGQSGADSLEEFIIVVHKRTGADSDVTRCFLSDIFILMSCKNDHHSVEGTIRKMKEDLDMIKESIEEEQIKTLSIQSTKDDSSYFRLDEMLKSIYEDRILQENTVFCGAIGGDIRELKLNITGKNTHENILLKFKKKGKERIQQMVVARGKHSNHL